MFKLQVQMTFDTFNQLSININEAITLGEDDIKGF